MSNELNGDALDGKGESLGAAALRLAELSRDKGLGIRLVPGEHRGEKKKPRITRPSERASADSEDVSQWWRRWPDALVMLVLGRRVLVLDIDMKNGKDGQSSLERLCADLGMTLPEVTPTVETSNGGMHIYLLLPDGVVLGKLPTRFKGDYPGIDIITGDKLLLAAPPSPHQSGGHYEWAPGKSLFEVMPAAVPPELMNFLLTAPKHGRRKATAMSREALPNVQLVREMLLFISKHEDRDTWMYVGMGLHHGFEGADEGRELWHEWSQRCPDKYESEEVDRQWSYFQAKSNALTIEALVGWARTAGWTGRELCVEEAPEPVKVTLPIAEPVTGERDDRLWKIAEQAVAFTPGQRSVAVSGPPGLSKTRSARAMAVELLRRGQVGTIIMAFSKRMRIEEVCGSMGAESLEQQIDQFGGRLTKVMGRGKDPDEPFYCSYSAQRGYGARVRLGRTSCLVDAEHAKYCGYVLEKREAQDSIASPGPLFIATTIDYLRHLRTDLEAAGRTDAVLIADDPGPEFGLFTKAEFHRGNLKRYRHLLDQWEPLEFECLPSGTERLVSVLQRATEVLLIESPCLDDLAKFTESLAAEDVHLIRNWDLKDGFRLPWEEQPTEYEQAMEGRSVEPTFGRRLIGLLQHAVEGRPGALKVERGQVVVAEANDMVIDKIRQGRCLFLSVGPMMDFVVQALGVERRHATWKLANQIIRIKLPGILRGRGAAYGKPETRCDKLLRPIAHELAESFGSEFALITTKSSKEALHDHFESHGARLGYYHLDHAGTNRFDKVKVLMIQRYKPHPEDCAWIAVALEGVLGLSMTSVDPEAHINDLSRLERRWCSAADHSYCVSVPKEDHFRQVYRTQEAQLMVNAVGRCRPLTNPGTVIMIFDSDPVEGVQATEELTVDHLPFLQDPKGLLDLFTLGEAKIKHRELVREIVTKHPTWTPLKIHEEVLDRWIGDGPPTLRSTEYQVRAIEDDADCVSSSEDPNRGMGPSLTETVSPEVAHLLDPGWRSGRHGLPWFIINMTNLSRSTVSRCLQIIRGDQGNSEDARGDLRRNIHKVWGAIHEMALMPCTQPSSAPVTEDGMSRRVGSSGSRQPTSELF